MNLLSDLRRQGTKVELELDGRIRLTGIPITYDQKANIRKHRSELVRLLTVSGNPVQPDQAAEIIEFDREKARRDAEHNAARRAERREQVAAMMANAPKSQRYFWAADTESHAHYVILAFAIRDVGSGELSIPREKYDGFKLLEMLEQRI